MLGEFLHRVAPQVLAALMGQALTILVMSEFENFPGAPSICMDFRDPTAFSRFIGELINQASRYSRSLFRLLRFNEVFSSSKTNLPYAPHNSHYIDCINFRLVIIFHSPYLAYF